MNALIKVNFITIGRDRAIIKSAEGKPLFPDMMSAYAFAEYFKLGESGDITATIVSDTVVELVSNDNTDLSELMPYEVPQRVRMPSPQAIALGATTERGMFLYWNIHEQCGNWDICHI